MCRIETPFYCVTVRQSFTARVFNTQGALNDDDNGLFICPSVRLYVANTRHAVMMLN